MKWLHNLLKGCTLTTALFIFQACYGTPQDFEENFSEIDFQVVSASTNKPLGNVTVKRWISNQSEEWENCGTTDANGLLSLFSFDDYSSVEFKFEDASGSYQAKDTSFVNPGQHKAIPIALKEAIK